MNASRPIRSAARGWRPCSSARNASRMSAVTSPLLWVYCIANSTSKYTSARASVAWRSGSRRRTAYQSSSELRRLQIRSAGANGHGERGGVKLPGVPRKRSGVVVSSDAETSEVGQPAGDTALRNQEVRGGAPRILERVGHDSVDLLRVEQHGVRGRVDGAAVACEQLGERRLVAARDALHEDPIGGGRGAGAGMSALGAQEHIVAKES